MKGNLLFCTVNKLLKRKEGKVMMINNKQFSLDRYKQMTERHIDRIMIDREILVNSLAALLYMAKLQ